MPDMIIREDQTGEGTSLTFPGISTCTAVVAALADTLVGSHFTIDQDGTAPQTTELLNRLVNAINGRAVSWLLIVGFNGNHNPAALKHGLGPAISDATRCEAYDIARKDIPDVALFFRHNGMERPNVEFKRSTKVTVVPGPPTLPFDRRQGMSGEVTVNNPHLLRRHFTNL